MNKYRTAILNWGLVGASTCALPLAVHGLEASDVLVFSKGPVSLRPQFELLEQFTDNVYFQDQDRVSDLITIFSPGLRIVAGQDLPTEKHFILNYNLDQLLYIKESSQNATQHRLSTDIFYDWSRLSVEGQDRLEFLSGALSVGLSQPGRDPIDRLLMTDRYRIDYDLSERTAVYGEGRHTSIDFESGIALFDSRRIAGTGGFEYKYTPDTRFYGEVYYGITDLEDNANRGEVPGTTFVGGFLGARGNFTEKLRGNVKAGFESTSFSGGGGDFGSSDAPVVEASISYQFTDRSNLGLTYNRRQNASVQFTRSIYTSDSVTLAARQILGSVGRLRLNAEVTYQNLDFEPSPSFSERHDTNFSGLIAASWHFQTWLSTRLQYSYETYSSDLPSVVDYDANRVTLSLAVGY